MAEKPTYSFNGSKKGATKPMVLSYPNGTVYEKDTDYVSFEFKKYVPPFSKKGAPQGGNAVADYNRSINELESAGLARITMYMPEDLGVEYGATWGGKGFTNTGADALRSAGSMLTAGGDVGQVGTNISAAVGNMFQRSEALIADAIATGINSLPGSVGGSVGINDVLGGVGGVILNPNTELLFSGFDLRTFGLNFKMTPKDDREAKAIRDICTTFKRATLPQLATDGAGFNPFKNKDESKDNKDKQKPHNRNYIGLPSLCVVRFMKGSQDHPYLSQFKPCAITNVNISYTPDGQYSTYDDGSPVATTLTLQFTETKLVYSNEISYGGASL